MHTTRLHKYFAVSFYRLNDIDDDDGDTGFILEVGQLGSNGFKGPRKGHQIQKKKNWVFFETCDILHGSDLPDAVPPFWNILGDWKSLDSNYCRIPDVCLVK